MSWRTWRKRLKQWWPLAIPMVALLGLLSAQFIVLSHRPMFHNALVTRGMPLYSWYPEGPFVDKKGNAAIADYRLNLLVVFFLTDTGISPVKFWRPKEVADGVVFPRVVSRGDVIYHVPRRENTLMIFKPDGTRRDHPMMPGEAEQIHRLLMRTIDQGDMHEDFKPVLSMLYKEKHTEGLLEERAVAQPARPKNVTGREGL